MSSRSCISSASNTTFGLNVGSGIGVYKDKLLGNTLQFKTISATGTSIQIIETDNQIYISGVTGGGGVGTVTGATNLGIGNGTIYTTLSGSDLQFKSLSAGTNITLTTNDNYVGINAAGGSFIQLSDTPNYYAVGGIVAVNSGATGLNYTQTDGTVINNIWNAIYGLSGTSFINLTDTPNYYTAGAVVTVNSGATALEYAQTDGTVINNIWNVVTGTSFITLIDTPNYYTAGAVVTVNSGATGMDYTLTNSNVVVDIINELTVISGITYSNKAQIDAVDLSLLESVDNVTIPEIQNRLDYLDYLIYKNSVTQNQSIQILIATGLTSLIFSEIKIYYTHGATIKYVGNASVNNAATVIGKFESVTPTDYTIGYSTVSSNLYLNFNSSVGTTGTGMLVVRATNVC